MSTYVKPDTTKPEDADGASDVCAECGDEASLEIEGEQFCRDCGYTLLYKLPRDMWEALYEYEDAEAEGEEPPVDEEDIYHPPYPGNRKYSWFSRLTIDETRETPQYSVGLTKVVQTAPVETGEDIQVYATIGPHGIPVIDLYYVDDGEAAESVPNTRRLIDENPGASLTIPRNEVRKVFEQHLGIPLENYDGSDKLMLWPQAMPDRIRLYVMGSESEWEQMREEVTGEPVSTQGGDRVVLDLPDEPAAGIDPDVIESVVRDGDVGVDELVAALETVADAVDEEWADDVATSDPIEHDGRRAFAIPTSTWEPDGDLASLNITNGGRGAARKAHNEMARKLDDAADGDLSGKLMAYDGLVVDVE